MFFDSPGIDIYKTVGGSGSYVGYADMSTPLTAGTFYRISVQWDDGATFGGSAGDQRFIIEDTSDGSTIGENTINDTEFTGGGIGWQADVDTANNHTVTADYLRLQ